MFAFAGKLNLRGVKNTRRSIGRSAYVPDFERKRGKPTLDKSECWQQYPVVYPAKEVTERQGHDRVTTSFGKSSTAMAVGVGSVQH